jgi:tRNA(Glu) U13 pseudouridine synthase TruD
LRLSFTLPAGGYATEVLRQLTHEPFLSGSGHSKPAPSAEAESDSTGGD